MNREIRREIFQRLRAANPNPTTELEYRSTFELLIAVILSAQATDKSVNLATDGLFLLGQPNRSHSALPNAVSQPVAVETHEGGFRAREERRENEQNEE